MRVLRCNIQTIAVLALLGAIPGFVSADQLQITQITQNDVSGLPIWSWRVTYIANEGVLLGRDENSVLIDALFRDGVEGYDHLDSFRQDFLEKGGKPFNKVALLLATHKHADHFNVQAVARFLEENPEAVFASSPQVVELLAPQIAGDPGVGLRVRTVDPKGDEQVEFTVGRLKVEVLKLSHGGGKFSEVTNLGFIVHMGEKRVLHVGDAHLNDATMKPLARHAVGVDAACVPYWWLLEEKGRSFVRDTLKAYRVIALHIPPAEAEEIRAQIREADSTITVLLRFSQSISFGGRSKE